MTRQIFAVLLTILLTDGCFGKSHPSGGPSAKEQVNALAKGGPVEVRLANGSKLRGWVGDISETGFMLTFEHKKQFQKSEIAFDQVKAVKRVKSAQPSQTARHILIGVGVGAVVAAVVIVAVAAVSAAKGGFGNMGGGGGW